VARRTVQASELASFDFCRRAWGYTLAGLAAESPRLQAGRRWHEVHGHGLARARWLRRAGWAMLLAALSLTIVLWLVPSLA